MSSPRRPSQNHLLAALPAAEFERLVAQPAPGPGPGVRPRPFRSRWQSSECQSPRARSGNRTAVGRSAIPAAAAELLNVAFMRDDAVPLLEMASLLGAGIASLALRFPVVIMPLHALVLAAPAGPGGLFGHYRCCRQDSTDTRCQRAFHIQGNGFHTASRGRQCHFGPLLVHAAACGLTVRLRMCAHAQTADYGGKTMSRVGSHDI